MTAHDSLFEIWAVIDRPYNATVVREHRVDRDRLRVVQPAPPVLQELRPPRAPQRHLLHDHLCRHQRQPEPE